MRCQKALSCLSAQCDDTLSEQQRRELAAHLEECASCRREAFYFSEIKGQTGRLDNVRTRIDFNLRLKSRINTWEAEQARPVEPSLWQTLAGYPARIGEFAHALSGILYGPRRYALVGVASLLLAAAVWTGYTTNGFIVGGQSYTSQVAEIAPVDMVTARAYLVDQESAAEAGFGYLASGISLVDHASPRTEPNYVMPTVPAEQMSAQVIF